MTIARQAEEQGPLRQLQGWPWPDRLQWVVQRPPRADDVGRQRDVERSVSRRCPLWFAWRSQVVGLSTVKADGQAQLISVL